MSVIVTNYCYELLLNYYVTFCAESDKSILHTFNFSQCTRVDSTKIPNSKIYTERKIYGNLFVEHKVYIRGRVNFIFLK